MTVSTITLTAASAALFRELRSNCEYGDDMNQTLLRSGDLSAAQRGSMSDLKKKGLVKLLCVEDDNWGLLTWYECDMETEVVVLD